MAMFGDSKASVHSGQTSLLTVATACLVTLALTKDSGPFKSESFACLRYLAKNNLQRSVETETVSLCEYAITWLQKRLHYLALCIIMPLEHRV